MEKTVFEILDHDESVITDGFDLDSVITDAEDTLADRFAENGDATLFTDEYTLRIDGEQEKKVTLHVDSRPCSYDGGRFDHRVSIGAA